MRPAWIEHLQRNGRIEGEIIFKNEGSYSFTRLEIRGVVGSLQKEITMTPLFVEGTGDYFEYVREVVHSNQYDLFAKSVGITWSKAIPEKVMSATLAPWLVKLVEFCCDTGYINWVRYFFSQFKDEKDKATGRRKVSFIKLNYVPVCDSDENWHHIGVYLRYVIVLEQGTDINMSPRGSTFYEFVGFRQF